jgi:acyl carrier protein
MPEAADPVQSALAEVLHRTLGADPAGMARGSRLREDLGINSLTLIDVACAAEDRFGVRVPDDDLEGFVTLGDAVDFLRAAGAEGGLARAG